MKVASGGPGYCSVCYCSNPELRHIDFEVAFEGAPVLDRETRTIAVIPWTGQMASHDDLYICENCIKDACEKLGFQPELHARQVTEIKRLELENQHWRATVRRQQQELNTQYESAYGAQNPRRRREVAA